MTSSSDLRQLFDRAAELPAGEQAAFLDAMALAPAVRAQLDALLAADGSRSGLLDTPAAQLVDRLEHADDVAGLIGAQVGSFRLLGLLGQGGTSVVFHAERTVGAGQQRVALKLLRTGLYSAEAQRRFRREQAILAQLSHPNIAHLIEGGVTAAGIPYLAMEYVDGLPITRHAAEHRLDVRARLQLMTIVCRAAAAAHRALVVHRDLKPSNILVAAVGTVKLLDFGIAKLLDEELAGGDGTRTGESALTPGYGAPEQYRGGPTSTATDVYALGVVLYELLLGERPPPGPPQRPSAHAATLYRDLQRPPASRAALRAALKGDIDNILLKALAEEPDQRYAGAAELAEDIQRHLDARPVAAHPPSTWYRTRKFVRRHRGGVLLTSAFLIGLVASLGIAVWQATIARQQTHAAQREAQRAQVVRDLLVGLFENEAPGSARDALPDTATLLERATERARHEFGDSAVRTDLLVTLGQIHNALSRYAQARPLLEQAVATARTLPRDESALLGTALSQLGQLELSQQHYDAAVALFDEAVGVQERQGPDSLPLALTLHRRGQAYADMDRPAAAAADLERSLAIRRALLPEHHPDLVNGYTGLGKVLNQAGRFAQAEPFQRTALALARHVHGDVHGNVSQGWNNLAWTLMALGRHEEAAHALGESLAIERVIYPEPNKNLAVVLYNLGYQQIIAGELEQAELSLRECIDIHRRIGLDTAQTVGSAAMQLSRVRMLRSDHDDALALAIEAETILASTLPPQHRLRFDAALRIVLAQLMRPNPIDLREHAAALHAQAEQMQSALRSAASLHVLGLAHLRAGEPRAAAELIERAVETTAGEQSILYDPPLWFAALADARIALGDCIAAEAALQRGIEFADARSLSAAHPTRRHLLRVRETLSCQ
jgi:eukaryotic-like serine/threonine-protein kinase